MNTLKELYDNAILPADAELEKKAAELYKEAEEEEAAGRIMARGFANELKKLAEGQTVPPKPAPAPAPAPAPKPAPAKPPIMKPDKTPRPGGIDVNVAPNVRNRRGTLGGGRSAFAPPMPKER